MKVKDLLNVLQERNPEEELWATYITKEDIQEAFSNVEYTDENDELIDTDPFVTDDVAQQVFNSIDNDDYLWERFNENFSDICREIIADIFKEKEEAKEDSELWEEATNGNSNSTDN